MQSLTITLALALMVFRVAATFININTPHPGPSYFEIFNDTACSNGNDWTAGHIPLSSSTKDCNPSNCFDLPVLGVDYPQSILLTPDVTCTLYTECGPGPLSQAIQNVSSGGSSGNVCVQISETVWSPLKYIGVQCYTNCPKGP